MYLKKWKARPRLGCVSRGQGQLYPTQAGQRRDKGGELRCPLLRQTAGLGLARRDRQGRFRCSDVDAAGEEVVGPQGG